MHETHLIEPVIKGILAHAKEEGATKITKLRVKIGLLTGIKEESFRETFKALTCNTMLENTDLEINFFPAERIEVVSFDIE